MKIYVGNLAYETSEDDIKSAFEMHGEVKNVNLIKDNYSGKSKGFAFVEMSEKAEAEKAIAALNGKDLNGRNLNVNEARPQTENRSFGNRPQKKPFRKY
ncbi:RNA-binding protein [candidate division FCPU426 bacterium]|nr:RNA-binding protein [candidate division FCPU426 bacterium]